ncbi:MAG TPA: FAD-dependent oxidoreductase [Stenomitos sp.]
MGVAAMADAAQVVIVGAGPTGLTLALLLVQRGISVKLIEASRNFRRSFRGEGLMPNGLDALEQMDLLSTVQQIPHQTLDAWTFLINDQVLFRADEPFEKGGRATQLVSQPALLEQLIIQAQAYPHFEWIQGVAVQDLLWRSDRVCGVQLANTRHIEADLVIGADGRRSVVRQKANLPFQAFDAPFNLLWFQLADHPRFAQENIFYSILKDEHAFGLFRSSEGHLQIGWTLRDPTADWKNKRWDQELIAASPPWFAEHLRSQVATLEPPVLLSVKVGRCASWHQPGVLLLGDAAHPMSPLRAQGINMALRDVIVAANHLVPVLRQNGSLAEVDAVLPQIQAEREPEIRRSQRLQHHEAMLAHRLSHSGMLRYALGRLSPMLAAPIRQSWLRRQRALRAGSALVRLIV